MHKQVEKLDRHFHKFLALRSQGKRLVTAAIWPSIKDADKAPPSARQWRVRGVSFDPTGRGRCAHEVSARMAYSCAKPRHRLAGSRRCVDTIKIKTRATSDAKGGTQRRPDATVECTSNGGTENACCAEFPRVSESAKAYARHGCSRLPHASRDILVQLP